MRDSAIKKREHAYLIYEVLKCQESLRATTDEKLDPFCVDSDGPMKYKCKRKYKQLDPSCVSTPGNPCKPLDPVCKPLPQINGWLSKKNLHWRVLNTKVDFS
jgi:hypothetical protein